MFAIDDESRLTREGIEKLAADPAAHGFEAIRAAVVAADYEDACARALARVHAGHSIPAALMAQIVPGVQAIGLMVAMIALSSDDRVTALLELVERQRFRDTGIGEDQAAVALLAAWRLGDRDRIRPRVTVQIRLLARRQPSDVGAGLLVVLAREVTGGGVKVDESGRQVDEDLGAQLADVISAELLAPAALQRAMARLDDFRAPRRRAIRVTVQGGQRPGRNEPCPCGTGRKFKHCCEPHLDAKRASTRPGEIAWSLFLAEHSDQLKIEQVNTFALRDLARLDAAKLGNDVLLAVAARLVRFRRWDLAERYLDIARSRPGLPPDDLEVQRAKVVISALRCREVEVARTQLRAMRFPDLFPSCELAVAIAEGQPDALARLLSEAESAIADPTSDAARMLVVMLLLVAPGLGLLVARGFQQGEPADRP